MPSTPGCRHPRGVIAPPRSTTCGSPTDKALTTAESTQRRIGVDQDDPAGMLGLRRAHQAPDRGAGQVGDVLAGQRRPRRGSTRPARPIRVRPARTAAPPARACAACVTSTRRPDPVRPQRNRTPHTSASRRLRRRRGGRPLHLEELDRRTRRPPRPSTAAARPGGRSSTPPTAPAAPGRRRVRSTPRAGPTARSAPAPTMRPPHAATTPCHENGNASTVPGVRHGHGVQRRVEQHRVHAESGDATGRLGQATLGEDLLAATPHRGQTLERGPVLVAARSQSLIGVGHVDGGRAGGRPHRQIGARRPPLRATTIPSACRIHAESVVCPGEHRRLREPDSSAAPTITRTATDRRPTAPAAPAASVRRPPGNRLRRRRGWPTRRTRRRGTAPPRRRRDRTASSATTAPAGRSARPGRNRGSSTTAPSSACSARSPGPARRRPTAAPPPDNQKRRRSKAYVGRSTKPAPGNSRAPVHPTPDT